MKNALALVAGWIVLQPMLPPSDETQRIELSPDVRRKCLEVLRQGLAGEEFWPAMHAAEGLTAAGHANEVIASLTPRLSLEKDDQRRCGLARELVRAGDRGKTQVMLEILSGPDDYGHVHAAESLYKVFEIGDGRGMRKAFAQTDNLRLRLMAAGALARNGDPQAVPAIREVLGHDDPEMFKIAVWLLARTGDASDIPRVRANIPRAPDELNRAYHDHALAALGDPQGMENLGKNLLSDDPIVRTYAGEFAVDARAVRFQPTLEKLLNDPFPDARIRAAHALLALSAPPPKKSGEPR